MPASDIGLRLNVAIRLLDAGDGGRTQPVVSGYRPLCVVESREGGEVVIGLAELQLASEVAPGTSGEGVLQFSSDVADLAVSLLSVGTKFALAEGQRRVGEATVLDVLDSS